MFLLEKNIYNMSFKEETPNIREQVVEQFRDGIHTPDGKIKLTLPKPPSVRINIRAIPTECKNEEILSALSKYKCGNIRNIHWVYHRGTNIYNGYRTIVIENYQQGSLPAFIKLKGANCKIYLPNTEYVKKCNKCLQTGHTAQQCDNSIVCIACKKTGHTQHQCPEVEQLFPALTRNNQQTRNLSSTTSEMETVPSDGEETDEGRNIDSDFLQDVTNTLQQMQEEENAINNVIATDEQAPEETADEHLPLMESSKQPHLKKATVILSELNSEVFRNLPFSPIKRDRSSEDNIQSVSKKRNYWEQMTSKATKAIPPDGNDGEGPTHRQQVPAGKDPKGSKQ